MGNQLRACSSCLPLNHLDQKHNPLFDIFSQDGIELTQEKQGRQVATKFKLHGEWCVYDDPHSCALFFFKSRQKIQFMFKEYQLLGTREPIYSGTYNIYQDNVDKSKFPFTYPIPSWYRVNDERYLEIDPTSYQGQLLNGIKKFIETYKEEFLKCPYGQCAYRISIEKKLIDEWEKLNTLKNQCQITDFYGPEFKIDSWILCHWNQLPLTNESTYNIAVSLFHEFMTNISAHMNNTERDFDTIVDEVNEFLRKLHFFNKTLDIRCNYKEIMNLLLENKPLPDDIDWYFTKESD